MVKSSHLKNLRHAQYVAKTSMYLVVALMVIKGVGGYVTNTIALLGDAASTFGDLIATIAIFVGISFSLKPPSKRFKYGYHRIETFVSMIIAVMMIYFGVQILQTAIERIMHPEPTKLPAVGIIAAIISICLSLFTYFYQTKIAKKINSSALTASADDKRNDALVSFGVLTGIVTNTLNIPLVEKLIGIGIALTVLFVGLRALKDAVLYLLDYWDNPEITQKIETIIRKSSIVTGIKNLRLRHAGTYIFGEAFLQINPFTDITDMRDEIHRLDNEIQRKIPHLGDFVLYVDPPKPQAMTVAIPIREDQGLNSEIAANLREPFFFLLLQIKNRKIIKAHAEKQHTFKINQSMKIVKFLKEKKVNLLISSHIRALLFYNLRLNNIKVYPHFSNVKDVAHTAKLLLLDI